MMPLDDIAMKTRALIDLEHAVHTAHDSADGATDDCTNRACRPLTFAGSAFDASGHALSGGDRGRFFAASIHDLSP